MSGYDSVIA